MPFDPIRQLDNRLESAARRGAQVIHLGVSAEHRAIVAVRVLAAAPGPRVLVLAGMHAPELVGPLAALDLVENALDGRLPAAQLTVVPCVDRDGVAANLREPFAPSLPLGLPHFTDYEALLPTQTDSVGAALWPWLLAHDPVDALISLHSAAHVAPGAFVYAAARSSDVLDRWVRGVHAAAGPDFPWAAADPTGASIGAIANGVFPFPAAGATTMTGRLGSELCARMVAVSELPPAVAPSLAGAPLTEIHRASTHAPPDMRILPVEVQVNLMMAIVSEAILALEPHSRGRVR